MSEDLLYHFVGYGTANDDDHNYRTLSKVLSSGQVGLYPDGNSGSGIQIRIDPTEPLNKGELLKQSITCFCDIPFEQLELHCTKYGRFGLGLSKKWLARCGARPVIYVPVSSADTSMRGHVLVSRLRALIAGMVEYLNTPGEQEQALGSRLETYQAVVEEMKAVLNLELLTQLKFFNSDLPRTHDEYYLAEQEWRKFLPVPLELALCEVVVPQTFVQLLATDFPQYAERLRVLR